MSAGDMTAIPPVLRICGLTAGYGAHAVLRDVNLVVRAGEWLVVLGPNGSGKSTLLYAVAGLLRARSGRIEVAGQPLTGAAAAAKRALGYASAPERLPGLLTGRQCLQVYAAAKGLRDIDPSVLELAETLALGEQLDRFVDTYSFGMRQKLAILLALIGAPRLIVLDESLNGLDPASANVVKRHLRTLVEQRNVAVLLATHALEVAERYADRVALLIEGQVVRTWNTSELTALRAAGTPLEELLAAASAGTA